MTNEERWKIEGRTREDLRNAKQNIAALKISIEDYARQLEEAGGNLRHFLTNPVGAGSTGMTSLQYILHFFRSTIPANIEDKLKEFERESERLQELEKQVAQFGG
jgi:hypothetical protein